MKPKKLQWWIIPSIATASFAGLGALGTFIVKSADYIKLPEVLASEVKRNDTQDQRLDKLITLQELYQKSGLREWDGTDEQFWCCPMPDRDQCWEQKLWRVCE